MFSSNTMIKGNELFSLYGDDAIKEGIMRNEKLSVLKYLSKQNCELEMTYWEDDDEDEIDADTSWDARLLAVEYNRIDILKWLILEEQYDIEDDTALGNTILDEIISYKRFKIMKWIMDSNTYDCEDFISYLCKHSRTGNTFCAFFNFFLKRFIQAENFCELLEKGKKEYKPCNFLLEENHKKFIEKYIVLLKKALSLTINNKKVYYEILKSLSEIDKDMTFKWHVENMLQLENMNEVKEYCFDIINEQRDPSLIILAKTTLIELLLANKLEFDEPASPLEKIPLAENYLKRAIQAFYLLKDANNNQCGQLKQRLHEILSGNTTPSLTHSSINTWSTKAIHYFLLYVLYKNNPENSLMQQLMVLSNEKLLPQEAPKETVLFKNKRKYKQESIPTFFQPQKKRKTEEAMSSIPHEFASTMKN